MKYEGILNLNDNCEYTMMMNGVHYNISKTLHSILDDSVELKIEDSNGTVLFSEDGKLVKNKFGKFLYKFTINDLCFDDILWNLIGTKVVLKFKNKTVERGNF